MEDRQSTIITSLYIGIVLAALCLFPSTVFGNSSHHQESASTSGKHDPYFVCEQGQWQSPITIVPSENEGDHQSLNQQTPEKAAGKDPPSPADPNQYMWRSQLTLSAIVSDTNNRMKGLRHVQKH